MVKRLVAVFCYTACQERVRPCLLKMHAIREALTSGSEHLINMEDVKTIAKTIKSSVSEEDLANLTEFESKF